MRKNKNMRTQEARLSNGLRVVHLENPNSLYYDLAVRINVGLVNDPLGKTGLAHVLEHCVFMETQNLRNYRVQRILDSIGGSPNAYTSIDHTLFTFSANKGEQHFQKLADIARQILTECYFDPEKLANELKVIQNEYNDRLDNPYIEDLLSLLDIIIDNGADRVRVIGTPEEFHTITTDDLYRFVQDHYHVRNMTLYTGGALTLSEVLETLEETLSAVPKRDGQNPVYQETTSERDIRIPSNERIQNYYQLLFLDNPPTSLRELIVKQLANKTINSTLLWELRNKSGCCYGLTFRNLSGDKTQKLNALTISVDPEQTSDFYKTLVSYVSNIDSMEPDDIQAEYKKILFYYRNHGSWNANSIDQVIDQDKTLGESYDVTKIIDIMDTITETDIREEMKSQLSRLHIVSVKGPQTNLFPSLEVAQQDLRKAANLKSLDNPTPSNPATGRVKPRM